MATLTTELDGLLARIRKVERDTSQNLRSELQQIERERQRLNSYLDAAAHRIQRSLHELSTEPNGERSGAVRARSSKRIRRTPQQLKQSADAIFQSIKSKGEKGATGSEIRKHHPKVGPDIKGFLLKYAKLKLRTTGRKAAMRYYAG